MKYKHPVFIIVIALLVGAFPAAGLAGTASGGAGSMAVHLPPGTAMSSGSAFVVIPFLGPNGELAAGGKLTIWVGRSDGTAVANATLILKSLHLRNKLADGATLSDQYTITTNAEGLASIHLTTVPENDQGGGNDGGGPPA